MQLQLLQVAAFMRLMGQPIRWTPVSELTLPEVSLRVKLSAEEQQEWLDSFHLSRADVVTVDRVEALDALRDRLYILLGDVHAFGFGFIFPTAFRRVHESNMSKLWTSKEMETAQLTKTNLQFEKAEVTGDRCWLCKNEQGKVIKSPSYVEAALGELLDDLDGQELFSFDCAAKIIYGDAPEPDFEELFAAFGKETEEEE